VLGVACCKRPTRMVGLKLRVASGGHMLTLHHVALVLNGEQGNGGVTEDWQVALTELQEGLVGSPLQSVIKVVAPSRHGRVSGRAGMSTWTLQCPARTDSTGGHGTRESICSQSSAPHPGARWENRGGATRHNGTIRWLRGWRRGSHPSMENKGEMNQHFIHRTEITNQNSK
jgi:hypothetical protein